MSYEHLDSTNKMQQYRAHQIARSEEMHRAINEGRTYTVIFAASQQDIARADPRSLASVHAACDSAQAGEVIIIDTKEVGACHRPRTPPKGAADTSDNEYHDGQLYRYEALSRQMIPVEVEWRVITCRGNR